jgi:NADPH:quinone reductase-like Zn-dependent oxidoreductase
MYGWQPQNAMSAIPWRELAGDGRESRIFRDGDGGLQDSEGEMRAYRMGDGGTIQVHEEERPVPGRGEILVRVQAASINRRDVRILEGTYPLPGRPGVVPLSDGAGEVVAVGEGVTRFRVGDRVTGSYWPRWHDGRLRPELVDQLGCTSDGFLAEFAMLDEGAAVRVPDHLTWAEAAGLTCAGVTAWRALTGGQPVRPGDTVLTLGTGDVSLFAVLFGKLMGCRVVSTTSSEAKAARLRELGADHVIDYVRNPEWSREVREVTDGQGADVVVETHGPPTIGESIRASATYGQIVLLWVRPGELRISEYAMAGKLGTIRREFVGNRNDLEAMCRAMAAHGIRPPIDRVFPFDAAKDAYQYFEEEESFGKVVISIR